MTERNWTIEGREVAARAARNREFRASARVIAGAINDVYERTAAGLLEASAARAMELGLTVEEHHAAIEVELLLAAAEAAKAFALKRRTRSGAR